MIINFKFLEKNLGSKELIERLLVKFLHQLETEFEDLDEVILQKNESAPTRIHTLKGISGNLGATKLYEICSKIDHHYKNAMMIQSNEIEELNHELCQLKEELSKLYGSRPSKTPNKETHATAISSLKRATILVVDDSSANIEILASLLKDDYNIKIAKNGLKALEVVTSTPIDLILLDVVMPDMDGYQVCKALKNSEVTNTIPIIFITSNDTPEDEEYGLLLGAVDYIKKPFHPSIVKMRIQTHVNIKLKSDMYQELSLYDGLTHIPNRRSFDEGYNKLYKEAQREGHSIVVMMLDIDYFKPYNDNYGHGKGDETLIKVAAAISGSIRRPSDIVARYGGEEFVVVLKDVDTEGAKKVAQALVESVASLKIEHGYSAIASFITISVGVAYKFAKSEISQDALLKISDEALYRAKEGGKNRFEFVEVNGDV